MDVQLPVISMKILFPCIVIFSMTSSLPITSKPIQDKFESIEWSGWIMMAQSQPYQEKARKVTPKSIFVVPDRRKTPECPPGKHPFESRCVPIVKIDREKLLIAELTHMFNNGHFSFETEISNADNHFGDDAPGDDNSSYSVINEEPFLIDDHRNDNLPDAPLKFDIFVDSYPIDETKNITADYRNESNEKIPPVTENKTLSFNSSLEEFATESQPLESIKMESMIKLNNGTDLEVDTKVENETLAMSTTLGTTVVHIPFEYISTTEASESTESTSEIDENLEEYETEATNFPDLQIFTDDSSISGENSTTEEPQETTPTELVPSVIPNSFQNTSETNVTSNLNYEQLNATKLDSLFDYSTETVRSNEVEPFPTVDVYNNNKLQLQAGNKINLQRYPLTNLTTTQNLSHEISLKNNLFPSHQLQNSTTPASLSVFHETSTAALPSSTETLLNYHPSTTSEDISTAEYETLVPESTTTTPIALTTSTSKPSEFFWWLPSDWQSSANGEQSLLLRFWSALQSYRSRTK